MLQRCCCCRERAAASRPKHLPVARGKKGQQESWFFSSSVFMIFQHSGGRREGPMRAVQKFPSRKSNSVADPGRLFQGRIGIFAKRPDRARIPLWLKVHFPIVDCRGTC